MFRAIHSLKPRKKERSLIGEKEKCMNIAYSMVCSLNGLN